MTLPRHRVKLLFLSDLYGVSLPDYRANSAQIFHREFLLELLMSL